MTRKVLPSQYQTLNTELLSNPQTLDAYTQKAFGVSAQYLDSALKILMPVSQGRIPDAAEMKALNAAAKERYGWNEARTRSELMKILEKSSPEERIAHYLTANGQSPLNTREYEIALGLTEQSLKADLEIGIYNRLQERTGNNSPRDTFNGMPASKRVLEDSKDKSDTRATLTRLMGVDKTPSYKAKVHNVIKARHQLADRVELQAAQASMGHEPSLRESLANTYDKKFINEASDDLGLGRPLDDAEEIMADQEHLTPDFDVTANLND